MSPTSSELRRTRSDSRFRRALTLTVVGLVVLCAVFVTLGYLQGPKLASAQVDPKGVIDRGGQQLRLFANQAIAQVEPDQVTVSPAAAFTVSTDGGTIAVQFEQKLLYATNYTVTVTGVTSAYLARGSTLRYTFTTASPEVLYLDRGIPDDEIVRTGLTGSVRETVYAAPDIQDFVTVGNALLVATLAEDDTSSLDLVNTADGAVERLALPETGVIERLEAAASGSLVGFTLATPDAFGFTTNTLYTMDLDAGRQVKPVLGLDGAPLVVQDWQLVADSGAIVALTTEGSLLEIDPASGAVLPLGQARGLVSVSPDGSTIAVTDSLGTVALSTADGSQARVVASPIDGTLPYLGPLVLLSNGDRIEKIAVPDASGARFTSLLAYDDGTASAELYRTVVTTGSIEGFSVSPNGQFVAIEVIPDFSVSTSDGYAVNPRSTSITTVIVDVSSGAVTRSVEGFALAW